MNCSTLGMPSDARLEYLCIYKPDLDSTGDNIENQIVFYYSHDESEDSDLRLRRLGLAQGIVEFGRGFADGHPVSSIDTAHTRMVLVQFEEGWWVVACVRLAITGEGNYNPREVSPASMLQSQLTSAYRRWRMHHGTLASLFETKSRDQLVDTLADWWRAWCGCWNVSFSGEGAPALYDAIRMVKGQLEGETVQVIESIIDKNASLLDMVVYRYDQDSPENQGCVWKGKGVLSPTSQLDVLRWVYDCDNSDDPQVAYLEPSGFVYHMAKVADVSGSGSESGKRPEDSHGSWASSMSMSSVGTATVESLNKVMGIMSLNPMTNPFKSSDDDSNQQHEPADDLTESRFMIGLTGSLEDDQDDGQHTQRPVTSKKVHLQFGQSPFQMYNVVIYRRRPYTFALVFDPDTTNLNDRAYYIGLHRHLASLVEPMLTSLSTSSTSTDQINDQQHERYTDKRFYYLVHDPNNGTIQSSLPPIPVLPQLHELEKTDPAVAERMIMSRFEMIHVHQNVASIAAECGNRENERFFRTSRNWWVYWSRLAEDGREAIFVRKWTKSGKPPTDKSLLDVLGKDAKVWLDRYRYYGKV